MLPPLPADRRFEPESAISPLLRARWSVRAFDPARPVPEEDVHALVDAARTAPSAYNLQPWRLWIAGRGTPGFAAVLGALADYNAVWAHRAALFAVGIARDRDPDGTPCPWADYDLGQATALLTVEATARGLGVCQMAGVESDLSALTGCSADERVAIVSAIGFPGDESELDAATGSVQRRIRTRRDRRDAASIALR